MSVNVQEEEEARRQEEMERQRKEDAERRKQERKDKRAQLKKEGKLLTGKAKEEADRLARMREQMLKMAGVQVDEGGAPFNLHACNFRPAACL